MFHDPLKTDDIHLVSQNFKLNFMCLRRRETLFSLQKDKIAIIEPNDTHTTTELVSSPVNGKRP